MQIPNTFNLKVQAEKYIPIHSEKELISALQEYHNPFVLGGGSNMLLTKNITQPVFHILLKGISTVKETDEYIWLKAQAGENWHQFVRYTLQQGYGGLENLSLIYGNVGTTPIQNIGAYGVEIKDIMGIEEILDKYPYEISGGQKQRIAIARAVITKPALLLADEPTGALDSTSSEMILNLFRQINEHGQTVLLVTHSLRAASYAKRVLFIKDGIVFHEIYRGENEAQGDFMERISQSEFMLSRGKRL